MSNSLNEVVFDFQHNLTTWIMHRQKGELIPECWYHYPQSNNDFNLINDMLFERGFIPYRKKERGDDELTQIAN